VLTHVDHAVAAQRLAHAGDADHEERAHNVGRAGGTVLAWIDDTVAAQRRTHAVDAYLTG
jgi:acyl-CoA hydrolase